MKSRLIFRILGALASAFIIVSVFVPYVSVTGYSLSLWDTYELTNTLYLPIMIIAFGGIGIIFFSLNIKTEFAYMSAGATSFFVIMQTIDILNQGVFNTLSIGYYLLAGGTLFTAFMAFLTNLKRKQQVQLVEQEKKEEAPSVLDKINKLYDGQTEINMAQSLDNALQPLPIQSLDTSSLNQSSTAMTINQIPNSMPQELNLSMESGVQSIEQSPLAMPVSQSISPMVQELSVLPEIQPIQQSAGVMPAANPVIQDFNVPVIPEIQPIQQSVGVMPAANPVIPDFNAPVIQEIQPIQQSAGVMPAANPVIPEFNAPVIPEIQSIQQSAGVMPAANPVIQDFNVPVIPEIQPIQQSVGVMPAANPVIPDFNAPVIQEIQPIQQSAGVMPAANPVIPEFNAPVIPEMQTIQQSIGVTSSVNPVLQEFEQSKTSVFGVSNEPVVTENVSNQTMANSSESMAVPLTDINNVAIESSTVSQQNPVGLDIFGQPIN